MSSHARSSREEERRLSVRTLVIASAASAMAAIVTSQFWITGTPIAAALTPVIVTLVSELLHRPSQRIAERFTSEPNALPRGVAEATPETDARPEAAGAGPPRRQEERDPRPARKPPPRGLAGEPEFRVYRTGRAGASKSRTLPWKAIAVTATIAFVVGMAALTLPELIAGQSLGADDRKSTLFGGRSGDRDQPPPATEAEPEPEQSVPEAEPDQPDQRSPEIQPTPEQTTPSTPEQTTPPPAPQNIAPQVPPPR